MNHSVPSLFLNQTFHTQESEVYGSFANLQGVVMNWTELNHHSQSMYQSCYKTKEREMQNVYADGYLS
jgi:hypothetical protein